MTQKSLNNSYLSVKLKVLEAKCFMKNATTATITLLSESYPHKDILSWYVRPKPLSRTGFPSWLVKNNKMSIILMACSTCSAEISIGDVQVFIYIYPWKVQ